MDEFMDFILGAIKDHGSTAVRVFPPASHVLLLFSERLSSEVVSEPCHHILIVVVNLLTDHLPCRLGNISPPFSLTLEKYRRKYILNLLRLRFARHGRW